MLNYDIFSNLQNISNICPFNRCFRGVLIGVFVIIKLEKSCFPSVGDIRPDNRRRNNTGTMYTPPFTVSSKVINLIAEMSAQTERYSIRMEQSDSLRLRKLNRVKTTGTQEWLWQCWKAIVCG